MLAWKRSKRDAFLTGLSTLSVELKHKVGKSMHTSDFASRHPVSCKSDRYQICNFVNDLQLVGDNTWDIRSISFEDIDSG